VFTSIRTYRVGPGQLDEVVRRVDEEWADQLNKQKGFVSYLVVATGPDQLVSVTTFLEEETLAAVVFQSAEWVGAHLMDLDVTLENEKRGRVVSRMGE
jgi:hypothetical protein